MCSASASKVNEVKEALGQLEQTLKNAREKGDKKAYSLNPLQLKAAELAVSENSPSFAAVGTGKATTVVKFIEAFWRFIRRASFKCAHQPGKPQAASLNP